MILHLWTIISYGPGVGVCDQSQTESGQGLGRVPLKPLDLGQGVLELLGAPEEA